MGTRVLGDWKRCDGCQLYEVADDLTSRGDDVLCRDCIDRVAASDRFWAEVLGKSGDDLDDGEYNRGLRNARGE
jgi:hypothetical protein